MSAETFHLVRISDGRVICTVLASSMDEAAAQISEEMAGVNLQGCVLEGAL